MKVTFFLFPIHFFRYFKTAVLTLASILISSWGVAGLVSLRNHYTHKVAKPFESFDFLYDKPWQRVGTYVMGKSLKVCIHTYMIWNDAHNMI